MSLLLIPYVQAPKPGHADTAARKTVTGPCI